MSTIEMTHESHAAMVAEAVEHLAQQPADLLPDLIKREARKLHMLESALQARVEQWKFNQSLPSRLRLMSYLQDKGQQGVAQDGGMIVPDPLVDGDEVLVRDAQLLGHRPIIEKEDGLKHPILDYIRAFCGEEDVTDHVISRREVLELAEDLEDPDFCRRLRPHDLVTPNLALFEAELGMTHLVCTLAMNMRFAVIDQNQQILAFDLNSRNTYKPQELAQRLAGEYEFRDSKKPVSRFKIWFTHPARAAFDEVVFAPMDCDEHGRPIALDRKLNLWVGFDTKPQHGDWSLMQDHILDVLCSGNQDAYTYLLDWLAHVFQKPWEKPGVAIITWGKKRTGKGTVSDAIRYAVGEQLSRMFNQQEHVVGRFSTSPRPMFFNQIEEAFFGRDPRVEGPLKSRITDPTELIELKFLTPYEVRSCGRFWFNSNSETPVPITYDEERYFVLHVSDHRANDHAYFDAIRQQLYHQGGLEAMVYDLMHRDISDFNVRKPPHTAARAEMVAEMLDKRHRAILDLLREGEASHVKHDGERAAHIVLQEGRHTWIDKKDARLVFNDAFSRYGAKSASPGDLTRELKCLGLIDKTRNRDSRRHSVEAAYRFVPLEDARRAFAEQLNLDCEKLFEPTVEVSLFDQLDDFVYDLGIFMQTKLEVTYPADVLGELKGVLDAMRRAAKILRETHTTENATGVTH